MKTYFFIKQSITNFKLFNPNYWMFRPLDMINEDENIEDEEKEKKLGVGGTS